MKINRFINRFRSKTDQVDALGYALQVATSTIKSGLHIGIIPTISPFGFGSYASPPGLEKQSSFNVEFSLMQDRMKDVHRFAERISDILNRTCECNPSLKAQVVGELNQLCDITYSYIENIFNREVNR